jgi:hypothetical protein
MALLDTAAGQGERGPLREFAARRARARGASDDQFQSLAVNRADPSQLDASSAGIKLGPAHVHRALRKLAGIENSAVAQRFALDAEDVPLFA